jgi:Eukaryotic aspartyl protease
LWLNDLDANTGQVLFGGVNTAKYHGSLQTVPILQAAGHYVETLIALSGISVDGTDLRSSSLPAGVLLDSGTTLTYLPNEITRSIYDRVHAVTDTSSGRFTAYVPCALANEHRSLDFTFSGIKISVPYNELALPSKNPDGSGLQFDDGTPACVFGIAPSGGGTSVLGDTFLRSAYVVYDLVNNQISLAPTNFNSTTDNIKEIAPGPAGVPDAAMVPNPVTKAQHVGTGAARLAAVVTPTGTVVLAESAGASAGAKTHVAVCLISPVIVGVILSLWL